MSAPEMNGGKTKEEKIGMASRGFVALVVAQFLSAFADNALIFALLAKLVADGGIGKSALLQELFVIPYIVLAPFAGPIADAFPKAKVMLAGNFVKMVGTCIATIGGSPFLSYGIVGIGACIYSPAKYGILPQIIVKDDIVKANSAMEGGTITAILLGALAGGILASKDIDVAIFACLFAYVCATISNFVVPNTPAETGQARDWSKMTKDFFGDVKLLASISEAKASLMGTAAFWGAGAALRLTLVAWIPFALNLNGPQWVSYMMGTLSLGIVIGAALAAGLAPLSKIHRAYGTGPLIGASIIVMAFCENFATAAIFCAIAGIAGGFHVIPLNAMLQEKGHETVGSGRALAVQNLFENFSILLFAGAFSLFSEFLTPTIVAVVFGTAMIFNSMLARAFSKTT